MRWLLRPHSDAASNFASATGSVDADTACEEPVDIADLAAIVADEIRQPSGTGPWVMLNMVASVDGATAGHDNRSGSLSGPADRRMFHALRAVADVILAGASTVRIEHYGPPRVSDEVAQLRRSRGQTELPRLALVSRSLALDPASRLFGDAPQDQPPIVLTTAGSAGGASPDLRKRADIRVAGEASVDWGQALRMLGDQFGARIVLVEGGPTVNEQLAQDDLIDEICLSVAPLLAGGLSPRIVLGGSWESRDLRLDRIIADDGFLFLRYLRARD